jgi:hypothetical protein
MPPIAFDLGELAGIAQRGEGAIDGDRAQLDIGGRAIRPRHMQRRRTNRARRQ